MLKIKDLAHVTLDAVSMWIDILAYITYAVQFSYHSMLQDTSVQLLFGCNIIIDIHFQPNYKEMCIRNNNIINYNNNRENSNQLQYNYEVGHYAYILREGNYRKL